MKSHYFKILVVLITIVSLAGSCYAVNPIISHKAETYGHGNFTLDVDYSYEYERDNGTGALSRTNEVDSVLAYGLNERFDIIFEVPFEYIRVDNNKNYTGLNDISLEAKWKFYEGEELQLAIYPELTFPTADHKRGVGNGRMTYAVTLIATAGVDPLAVHLSVQYKQNENKTGARIYLWSVNMSPEIKLNKTISLQGNIGAENSSDRNSNKIHVNLAGGFSYAVTESLTITPVIKTVLNTSERDITFVLGTSWKF